MRIGLNPQKDKEVIQENYLHQIVIPVYIPNFEDYFKDSFKIFDICINSLLKSIHNRTFITIINNGSCIEVKNYLDKLIADQKIHEVIHTENIGKLNAILKGISGNNIPYVTISDADVLFCSNWQEETMKVFYNFQKTGVVGVTPQFKMYVSNCGNVLTENFFSNKVKFTKVEQPEALEKFYESIGWTKDYNFDYLKYNLSIENSKGKALLGSGHFVATYKKSLFDTIPTFFAFKMGGKTLNFLDKIHLKNGLWRLTTTSNFAFHMGNTLENWMEDVEKNILKTSHFDFKLYSRNTPLRKVSKLEFFIKNKLFVKLFFRKNILRNFFKKLFFSRFQLPNEMRNSY